MLETDGAYRNYLDCKQKFNLHSQPRKRVFPYICVINTNIPTYTHAFYTNSEAAFLQTARYGPAYPIYISDF